MEKNYEKDVNEMDGVEQLKRARDTYTKEEDVGNNYSQYDYQPSNVEFVMKHAEQFIIPECIECCKLLWSKGIDTFQCGNYNDIIENGFWVEIDTDSLSEENKKILEELSEVDSRIFFDESPREKHNYIIRVERLNNPNASQELCDIADNLSLQDTVHFTTATELLDKYKKIGGEYKLTETGAVYQEINPERQNATLTDALMTIEHPELYIAEEGRLYHNKHALNVHMNYLNQLEKSGNKHL